MIEQEQKEKESQQLEKQEYERALEERVRRKSSYNKFDGLDR